MTIDKINIYKTHLKSKGCVLVASSLRGKSEGGLFLKHSKLPRIHISYCLF
jgi:hypothetical protein